MQDTHTPFTPSSGDWWWRFSRYEVRDGYIRPAQGAKVKTYFPWSKYVQPVFPKDPILRSYHTLFAVLGKIDESPGDAASLIPEWCREHGLLGTLLHRCESVVFPPEAGKRARRRFTRHTRGWLSALDNDERVDAGAWMRMFGKFEARLHPIEDWARYFPNVNAPKDLPAPFSPSFWQEYAEPMEEFIEAAKLLRTAVTKLTVLRDQRRRQAADLHAEENLIHSLTATVRPMLDIVPTRYTHCWAGGSLLSNFAMMIHLDFVSSRPLICQNPTCGTMFVTNTAKGLYCSQRCRKAVQNWKYRERQKGTK